MTNQQGAPEALRLAAEVLDWMPTSDTQRPLWDRHQKALVVVNAALVEAQQPAPSAAAAEIVELLECSGCLKVGQKDRALAIVARLLPAQHGGVL